jgi:tetratricopeptide (TPR) repeat protein
MWIESFEDANKILLLNENIIEAYEQAAIALKNLNKIDQAIDILKRGISLDTNPNPFDNQKNLKMFALLEDFENEILKNEKIVFIFRLLNKLLLLLFLKLFFYYYK